MNFTDNFAVPQISSLLVAVIFSSSNRGSLLIALTSKLHFRIFVSFVDSPFSKTLQF